MRSPVYLKLAWETMIKNSRIYLPFLLGSIVMTMTLYSFNALYAAMSVSSYYGANYMNEFLMFGFWIIGLFSLFFMFYINGFVEKSRQKTYGLLSVLGLEKRHLARIVLYQTIVLYAVSTLFGLLFGIGLNRLMYLLIQALVQNAMEPPVWFNPSSALWAAEFSGIEYLLIYIWTYFSISKSKPIDMIQKENAGEQEPKSKWVLALLGLLCLAGGYAIALSVKDPLSAIFLFFVAVILVVIGTYLLFLYGSIALLKLLQKNKNYYYQTRHFLNVSNMKYRMKQNAVSLANICILSTMILVALSTTVTLFVGIDVTTNKIFPMDYTFRAFTDIPEAVAQAGIMEDAAGQLHAENVESLISQGLSLQTDGIRILSQEENGTPFYATAVLPSYPGQFSSAPLAEDEISIYTTDENLFTADTLQIREKTYRIKEVNPDQDPKDLLESGSLKIDVIPIVSLIMPDEQSYSLISPSAVVETMFDTGSAGITDEEVSRIAAEPSRTEEESFSWESREANKQMFTAMYSSFLFIGLFVSIILLLIIILIMYYKQISEGYEDQRRFAILQNTGMENKDIKAIITQQALWMFFLPLIAALIHIFFAYPLLRKMLDLLVLDDGKLFIILILGTAAIFALIYLIIYRLTARVYYSIVTQK